MEIGNIHVKDADAGADSDPVFELEMSAEVSIMDIVVIQQGNTDTPGNIRPDKICIGSEIICKHRWKGQAVHLVSTVFPSIISGVRLGNCMEKYEKSLFFTWHLTEGDFAALL